MKLALELSNQAERIQAASSVTVVGGGPSGVSVALNIKRTDPSKQVTLCISTALPLPGYHPDARTFYQNALTEAGVDIVSEDRVTTVDESQSSGTLTLASGTTLSSDAIIWTIGRRKPHTAFLPDHLLDEERFVNTKPTLEVEGTDNIFAIGDVASTDPDRSSARNWAYGILVHNLKRKAKESQLTGTIWLPKNVGGRSLDRKKTASPFIKQMGSRHGCRNVWSISCCYPLSSAGLFIAAYEEQGNLPLRSLFHWETDKRIHK